MKRKVIQFPVYQKTEKGLFAFLGPFDMYRISNRGSNVGCEGVCIDHFITRRMVIKHMRGPQNDITPAEFCRLYNSLFSATLTKIAGI